MSIRSKPLKVAVLQYHALIFSAQYKQEELKICDYFLFSVNKIPYLKQGTKVNNIYRHLFLKLSLY